jgi:hypothetical protein
MIAATNIFKPVVLANKRVVPVRRIAELHILEDLGEIPTAADWLRHITTQPWMNGSSHSAAGNTAAHAESSAKKFGGTYDLYMPIHQWLDQTRGWLPDSRHRAMRHHSEGVSEATTMFKPIELPDGSRVSVSQLAEQHVKEDLGRVPTAADYLRNMSLELWMTGDMHSRTTININGKWVAPPTNRSRISKGNPNT